MKKFRSLMVMLIGVLSVCLAFVACGPAEQPSAAEYSLNKTEITLVVGETHQIEVKSTQSGEIAATYASDTPACAAVSESGLVTAAAPGTAIIKVTVGGQELALNVKVEHKYELSKTSETLEEGDTVQLTVKTTPNKNVTPEWSVTPASVASVSNSGLVTALAEGTATVTAKVDGKTLTCAITVTEKSVFYVYTLNHTSENLEKGKTLQLNLDCEPARDDMQVEWESDNEAAVTVDEDGLVTAVAVGKANVNAKVDGSVVATCKVNAFEYVYSFDKTLELDYGDETAKLEVTITPEKPVNINYAVDGDDVITISTDGKITIVGVGNATVTVKDGETVLGTCAVTVKAVIEIEEAVQLHVGDTHVIEVVCNPADDSLEAKYEITSGSDVVELGSDGKTLTALKNGTATVRVTAGGAEKTCSVLVDDVNATVTATDIMNDPQTISGAGVEYWEQYINTNEINYKSIENPDEDIITRTWGTGRTNFFDDYATLIWTGGDPDCNKPEKPDGFREGALISVFGGDAVATLEVKAYAGSSVLKVYTGAFKGKNTVTLYNGTTPIASHAIVAGDAQQQIMLAFALDLKENATLTVKLELSDATADNSWLSLVAASITGDTYRVNNSSVRVAPEGTSQITVTKNGESYNTEIAYEVVEGSEYAEVSADGVITGKAIGDAKIKVTVAGRERVIDVNVGYAYSLNKTNIQLHNGGTFTVTAVSDPVGSAATAAFEIESGEDVINLADNGTITALKNGVARIKVTIDGGDYFADVLVDNVNASATVEKLGKDKANPIDITEGAEYWEQYIANGEINHKHYVNVEEDIITRICEVNGNYLGDYPAFLSWHDGGNPSNCDCGNCKKDSHTTPDGGWEDKGTKAYAVNVKDAVISLDIKVFAGSSVVKVYTGGYNLTGKLTLKSGETVVASATFDNKGAHNAQCVSFAVDVAEDTEITVEVVMTDDNGNAPHSCISIAAVSVSGDVYQLASKSARIIPEGTTSIVLNKNGAPLTDGVTYEVTEGAEFIELNNGTVTGKAVGTATVKVTANGRVRYFTAEVNESYSYTIDTEYVYLANGQTHQISVQSTPAGSQEAITYAVEEGDAVTVSESGLISAVKVGAARVSVSVSGQKMFTVDVAVDNVSLNVSNIVLSGNNFVDFTLPNVIYWEHYIWNEVNPKSVESADDDLISMGALQSSGSNDYKARIYFDGSSGPKAHSYRDDAYCKYSNNANGVNADVKLPKAGTYEIRVFTGVWKGINTVTLYKKTDADNVLLGSTAVNNVDNGTDALVTFTVTVTDAAQFALELKMDEAHLEAGRCKIAGIAIVDTSIICENVPVFHRSADDVIDILDVGAGESVLDWAVVGARMDGGNMIGEFVSASNQQGGDMPLTLAYNGETSRNFKYNDAGTSATVTVNNQVKKIAVYATGWESAYRILIKNAAGEVVYQSTVVPTRGNGSTASDIVFVVDTSAIADSETWTVETANISFLHNDGTTNKTEGNCGLGGIVLIGEAA